MKITVYVTEEEGAWTAETWQSDGDNSAKRLAEHGGASEGEALHAAAEYLVTITELSPEDAHD